MRLAAAAVVLSVALCACGDDISLRVVVDHPEGVAIDLTTVTIYESATLTCIDVAFQRFGADELDALKVADQTVHKDGSVDGTLDNISRVDHKVIVARGYDEAGAWVTAGCAEHDVVEEATKIVIDTMPTVTASPVLDADASDPFLAVLAATDSTGKAVTDRRVGWNVYAPAGSMPVTMDNVTMLGDGEWRSTKAICTQANGAAVLHPPPSNVIGGYAVQLRAEWAIDLPARYSRFIAGSGDKTIVPPNSSKKYCAIRKSGATTRVVCLDGTVARDFEVVVANGLIGFMPRGMQAIAADIVAVVSVPSGADRDVYAVNKAGALTSLFNNVAPDNSGAPCASAACEIEDVMAVPPCGMQPGKLLMKIKGAGTDQLKQLNARGGGTFDIPLGAAALTLQVQLDNAGCVTRVDPGGGAPTLRQVMTFHLGMRAATDFTPNLTRAIYNCNASTCMSNELFPGAGVAFTTGGEPRMIATFVDATGPVVAELVMAPDTALRDLFVERSRTPAAGIPDRMVVGNFDGDTDEDWFWNIGARRGATFEVAYAREVDGVRLEALSLAQSISITGLAIADLTGDGHDDIMMIGDEVGGTMAAKLAVVPMQTKLPALDIKSDSTCSN